MSRETSSTNDGRIGEERLREFSAERGHLIAFDPRPEVRGLWPVDAFRRWRIYVQKWGFWLKDHD